jgi:phosphoglycolate phosphatase
MMKYDTVIWDFNGTLLDDIETGISAVNDMLSRRGLKTLGGAEDYYEKFGFPIRDYYRRLGFDFSSEPFEKLAIEWVGLYLKFSRDARLRLGIESLLGALKKCGCRQIILSATEREMLEAQLSGLGIREYFDSVIGGSDIHADGKLGSARELKRTLDGTAVMIGDTLHDFEAACELGVDCILLCGGHNSESQLKSCGAVICKDAESLAKTLGVDFEVDK